MSGCPDCPEDDEALDRVLDTTLERWADLPPMIVVLPRQAWWAIMVSIQTTTRDMCMHDDERAGMVFLGRQIQNHVCDDVEIWAIAERGWGHLDQERTTG